MPASKQELLKDTNGECSPNTPVIEVVSSGSSSFTRLKKEMYISDDYEAELCDLIKQKKAVVLAVEVGGRYVGRVTLRHDWGDETSIIERDFPGLPQINALEIDEDYRRQGLATMLIEIGRASCRERV